VENIAAAAVAVPTIFDGGLKGAGCRMCEICCKCGGEVLSLQFKTSTVYGGSGGGGGGSAIR